MSRSPLVSLRKAAKFYGERLVFRNLDLDVGRATVLLVAGANGAGKSTLLRVMCGLSRPSAGTVALGLDKSRMAYLGHRTFLYPEATALENLRFWCGLHGLRPSDAALERALNDVGLAAHANERAGRFSRGMSQRLNLARAFCLSPELLFLDEPDTGLDRRSMAVLHRQIEAVRVRGGSVIWVSHHLERDLPRADTALLLEKGRAAYLGPAEGFDPSEFLAEEGVC
ncbi:ATP-binding cassette domain-containing protein [Fundidesulfovibrio butyratiphilus]